MRRGSVLLILLIVLCSTGTGYSQNINGHWYGVGVLADVKTSYDNYLTELVLRQKGKNVWGEFQYYFKDSLVKVPVKGSFDKGSRQLTLKPFTIIYYRSPNARNSTECVMGGYFRLVASKTGSVLQGGLMADEEHKYTIPDINYRLRHSNDTAALVMKDEEAPPARKPVIIPPRSVTAATPVEKPVVNIPAAKRKKAADTSLTVARPPLEIAKPITPANAEVIVDFYKREKDLTRVLEVNNATLRLEIFDNGQIDNDSISVFFNNTMIQDQTMLGLSPIKLNIRLDPSLEYNELGMLAINLGTIPPNTALLVLYDGNTRHEIFLSSDLGKSAVLRIRQKKTVRN